MNSRSGIHSCKLQRRKGKGLIRMTIKVMEEVRGLDTKFKRLLQRAITTGKQALQHAEQSVNFAIGMQTRWAGC